VLKGMAAFEEAKPVVSTHPRKDFAVPIRTIFSDGKIKHNFSQKALFGPRR
jgi:hypothetical protein